MHEYFNDLIFPNKKLFYILFVSCKCFFYVIFIYGVLFQHLR